MSSFVPELAFERHVSSVKVTYPSSKRSGGKPKAAKGPRCVDKTRSFTRHSVITPEHVSRMHNVGLDKAKQMLRVTTQKGIRTAVHPIHRGYRVDHLDLHAARLKGTWYVDWMHARTKSLTQCTGAFVYSNGTFTKIYPTETHNAADAAQTLREFCSDVGIPEKLKSDRAPELCGRKSEFRKVAQKNGIDLTYAEPERKNQIWKLDLELRELKKRWHNKRRQKGAPNRLWDFGVKHQSQIMKLIPKAALGGRTALENVTGKTPDISEYCDFDFYDLVWYFPGVHPSISQDNRALGRWLGVSHRVGSDMCYWILTEKGDVVADTTVQHVTGKMWQSLALIFQRERAHVR